MRKYSIYEDEPILDDDYGMEPETTESEPNNPESPESREILKKKTGHKVWEHYQGQKERETKGRNKTGASESTVQESLVSENAETRQVNDAQEKMFAMGLDQIKSQIEAASFLPNFFKMNYPHMKEYLERVIDKSSNRENINNAQKLLERLEEKIS